MQIPVIKELVERYSTDDLQKAEEDLLEERPLSILISGDDPGDQLTNIMAAIWIKFDMEQNQHDLKTALRAYTQKVRNSIN